MRLPDSYLEDAHEISDIPHASNPQINKWYLNALSGDQNQLETSLSNKFNSINPLIVENRDNFQVANILDKDLQSCEFQDYINHYQLLDSSEEESNQFYDLENFDLSFIYNENFGKLIKLADTDEFKKATNVKDEFELDEELIDIVGMDNMILNQSTKKYRVDHMFLSKKQKYELKKYRNRKASKKFRFKKKNKTTGLEKHLENLLKVCSELELRLEDLLEENSTLRKEFKVRVTK